MEEIDNDTIQNPGEEEISEPLPDAAQSSIPRIITPAMSPNRSLQHQGSSKRNVPMSPEKWPIKSPKTQSITSAQEVSIAKNIDLKNRINALTPHIVTPAVSPRKSPQRKVSPIKIASVSPPKMSIKSPVKSLQNQSIKSIQEVTIAKSAEVANHIDVLAETVNTVTNHVGNSNSPEASNVDKISTMSQVLTNEAKALRQLIKSLSDDIVKTKKDICLCNVVIDQEDVSFPYHLFLIELIVNKIHMKCECFDLDYNNLIIAASFLGKQPIVLYDASYGKIHNFNKLNVGKSTLFAMTYDKICTIKQFEIVIELTKQPPCSNCVTRIGETHIDYTNEFLELRDELCKKWMQEQPNDNILCTTSTPLSKNLYYVSCGDIDHQDAIGVIEVTVRMSFLGKEITTAFTATPRPQGTSRLHHDDNGMAMYSSQKVEMDDQGKILLDEEVLNKPTPHSYSRNVHTRRSDSPQSQLSCLISSKKSYGHVQYSNNNYNVDGMPKYDEILTRINENELKIKVPKSTRVERMGKYDKIQELCSCEATPYNTGEQIQFAMPPDLCGPDNTHRPYSSNLTYTYSGCNKTCDTKNRKTINVTPTNCPVPVAMEKAAHPIKDVFILKIGKKMETKDKKTDLEIELVTPKAPREISGENTHHNVAQQSSNVELKEHSKDGKKKGKNKKEKGAKAKNKKAKKN